MPTTPWDFDSRIDRETVILAKPQHRAAATAALVVGWERVSKPSNSSGIDQVPC